MNNIPVMLPYFDGDELNEVEKVLASGWVAQGSKVAEFEQMVARYENVGYGVATTSCTTALHLALLALGVNENHDCIVPSFTFTASPNAVLYTGATPIFADVSKDTYNLDPESVEQIIKQQYNDHLINKQTGKKLKAIMAVSLFGLPADLPRINKMANHYGLVVLQDSACAFGAKIGEKMEAEFGNMSCLSFHPRKSITTGEGGMILTDDPEKAAYMKTLRSHGATISEIDRHRQAGYLMPNFNELGYNYRMTDIQAAVGVAQMRKMDFITGQRREKASFYDHLIKEMQIDFLIAPQVPETYYHTYQSYVCVMDMKQLGFVSGDMDDIQKASDFRNEIMGKLDALGIASRVGTHATHLLQHYKDRYDLTADICPVSYMLDGLSITLPLYVQMTAEDQVNVLETLLTVTKQLMRR